MHGGQYLLLSAVGEEFLYYLRDCSASEEELYSTDLISQEIIYGTVLTNAAITTLSTASRE
jgi:hypothetical protein